MQLASGASKQIYLNRGGYQGYSRQYDETALPALKRFLDEKSTGKRVFFLHLMGSHVNYASRYPSEFNVFTDEAEIIPKPWHTKRSAKYINNYDNSILYTDFVLSGIIDLLRTVPNSALLYFSDHGGGSVRHALPAWTRRQPQFTALRGYPVSDLAFP